MKFWPAELNADKLSGSEFCLPVRSNVDLLISRSSRVEEL